MTTQQQQPGRDPNLQVVWWCHGCRNCMDDDGAAKHHTKPCTDSPSMSGALVRFVSASWGSPTPAPEGDTEPPRPIDYSSPLATVLTGWERMKSPAGPATAEAFCAVDAAVAKLREAAEPGDTEEPPTPEVVVRRWDGTSDGLRALAEWAGGDPTGEPQFSWVTGDGGRSSWADPMLGEQGIKPGDLFTMVDGWVVPVRLPEPGDTETVTLYKTAPEFRVPTVTHHWHERPEDAFYRPFRLVEAEFTRTGPVRPASSTEGGDQ